MMAMIIASASTPLVRPSLSTFVYQHGLAHPTCLLSPIPFKPFFFGTSRHPSRSLSLARRSSLSSARFVATSATRATIQEKKMPATEGASMTRFGPQASSIHCPVTIIDYRSTRVSNVPVSSRPSNKKTVAIPNIKTSTRPER